MKAMVPVAAKKEFLRWFLKRYRLKRRECVWILNYLLSNEHLLTNVHFTNDAHHCPRAMIISTTEVDSIPFRFYKGTLMTADAEKSFHDLRLHPDEDMFIQLNFNDSNKCPEYASVAEENPYLPEDLLKKKKDQQIAEKLLEESFTLTTNEMLLKKIDEALDKGDRELFISLTAMLNEMKKDSNAGR